MLNEQITIADPATIKRDLARQTARWHELGEPAVIELRAFGPNRQPHVAHFPPDQIDDAADWAAGMNAHGLNVYAVRNPVRATIGAGKSASDADIIAAFYLWADCDTPDAFENVRRTAGPKWSWSVTTGTIPHRRVHPYWELDTPCRDLARWRALQVNIASHFGSDGTVINPSRIMRLGGTVAYPDDRKAAKGYVREVTRLTTTYPDPREPITIERAEHVFTPREPVRTGITIDTGGYAPPLDREREIIQALSGENWHKAVVKLVGSYVARGLSDPEIHNLTDPLTLAGYTVDETRAEVQAAIDGARRKGFAPEQAYADPAAIIPPEAATNASEFDTPRRPVEIEWFDDIEASVTDDYLIKGFLATGSMSVIYGPSNSGKTFSALDIAFSIASGAEWQGRRVRQASILYLAAEGGRGVLNRIAALKAEHGVLNVPFALKRAGLDLLHDQADLQHIADLATAVKAAHPDLPMLIVIDTLSRIMAGGDENSAADMTALIRNIDAIREATAAHVMLVHHTGKDAAKGARGHSSLRAATDTEIEVSNEDGARTIVVQKQRDYAGGETFNFTLKSVELGRDQDGDPVTSCVVVTVTDAEAAATMNALRGIGGNQKLIADTFDQMLAEGLCKPNPGGVGMPESGKFWCVDKAELRRLSMGKMVSADPRSGFNKALGALIADRGVFVTGENLVWRTDRKVQK